METEHVMIVGENGRRLIRISDLDPLELKRLADRLGELESRRPDPATYMMTMPRPIKIKEQLDDPWMKVIRPISPRIMAQYINSLGVIAPSPRAMSRDELKRRRAKGKRQRKARRVHRLHRN